MLTVEDLAPAALARKLEGLLSRLDAPTRAALAPAFENIVAALIRAGDQDGPKEENAPIFIAYGRTQRSRWLRIGMAFQRRKGPGMDVALDALPLNFNGRIELVEENADLARYR
jgi:hypothetical protein